MDSRFPKSRESFLIDLCSWPALGSEDQRSKETSKREESFKEEPQTSKDPMNAECKKLKKHSKLKQGKTTSFSISEALLIAASNKIQASKKKNEKRMRRGPKRQINVDIVKKKGKVREESKVRKTWIKRAITLGRLQRQTSQCSDEIKKIENELEISKQILVQRVRKQTSIESELPPCIDDQEPSKTGVHSRRFRPYCNNVRSDEMKDAAHKLVDTLRGFQENMYHRDPGKARVKKRFVCGFNEVRKFVKLGDAKIVLVAMDIECTLGDPVYCMITELTKTAKESNIPLMFVGSKREFGKWTRKKSGISVIALLNTQGAEEHCKDLLSSWEMAKKDYEKMIRASEVNLSFPGGKEEPVEEIKNKIIEILSLSKSRETKSSDSPE